MRAQIAHLIATCGSIGYVRHMPGTIASIVAGIFMYCVYGIHPQAVLIFLVLLSLIAGWWASVLVSIEMKQKDPSCIVIDEWGAVWVLCLFLPHTAFAYIIGISIFRFFDIVKPWPISRLEKLPHGWGIMLDDLGAVMVTLVLLKLVAFI